MHSDGISVHAHSQSDVPNINLNYLHLDLREQGSEVNLERMLPWKTISAEQSPQIKAVYVCSVK